MTNKQKEIIKDNLNAYKQFWLHINRKRRLWKRLLHLYITGTERAGIIYRVLL